jgi:Holliday junction resolvase RusA-like endonuclease
MKKIEREYQELYGRIPKDKDARFEYMLSELKLKPQRNKILDRIYHIRNIHWNDLDFVIYLVPTATPRPRFSSVSNTFYVSGAKVNRDIFKEFAKKNNLPHIVTQCKLECVSYLPIPRSMSKADTVLAEIGWIRPITKPDWDNLGKTYSDMIQSTLLEDDSLIIEGTSKKYYSLKPRIEIHIEWADEHDCPYNYNKLRKKG